MGHDLLGLWLALRICIILSAARTGTVLFSTTILLLCAMLAIMRAASSTYLRSAARPRPLPNVFVGVFTEMKIRSASTMAVSMSVEKNRLRLRHCLTTASRPGCVGELPVEYDCTDATLRAFVYCNWSRYRRSGGEVA